MSNDIKRISINTGVIFTRLKAGTAKSSSNTDQFVVQLTEFSWKATSGALESSFSSEGTKGVVGGQSILSDQYPSMSGLIRDLGTMPPYPSNSAMSYVSNIEPIFDVSTEFDSIDPWPIVNFSERPISISVSSSVFDEKPIEDMVVAYNQVGDALYFLSNLDDEDNQKIEASVLATASSIALCLVDHSIQAPKVFNHGPKSVVFNWTDEDKNNLYLTVSAYKVSALLSKSNRQKHRMECSAKEFLDSEFAVQRLTFLDQSEPRVVVTKSSSNTPEIL